MSLNNNFIDKAKEIVVNYYNEQHSYNSHTKITNDNVFIVWFCKTLQNWKALVGVTILAGKCYEYYEVTYNGDKHETYLDVYQKVDNIRIPDNADYE